jgi:hypothetical protein
LRRGDRSFRASDDSHPDHPGVRGHHDAAVEIRDHAAVQVMRVREVDAEVEWARLWKLAVAAYPPYAEYQARTTRRIPVFIAEPSG